MSAKLLLREWNRISDTPESTARIRAFVTLLAVSGRLDEQDASEHPPEGALPYARRSGTEGTLPANWLSARLGDVLDVKYGKGLSASDRAVTGPVPVYGSNGIVAYTSQSLEAHAAIIIGRKGSAGALVVASGPSWTTDVAYFVVPPPFFEIGFLFLQLKALRLEALSKGVKPGLSRSDMAPLSVAVPPLPEQRRIVTKVREFMALCDRFDATQHEGEEHRDALRSASLHRLTRGRGRSDPAENARRFLDSSPRFVKRPEHVPAVREAILDLAVQGRLARQSTKDESAALFLRSSSSAPSQSDTNSDTSSLPTGWATATIGQLASTVTSGSRGWAEFYTPSGAAFIRAQNIRFGSLRLDDLAHVTLPEHHEGKRTRVSRGDILVVITGAGVTNPAVLDRDLEDAYVSQHVGLIKLHRKEFAPWILLCLMAPSACRDELVSRAYGAGKPGLNLDNIRTLVAPIPPLAEQTRILSKVVKLMKVCDDLVAALKSEYQEKQRLLKMLLHEALSAHDLMVGVES